MTNNQIVKKIMPCEKTPPSQNLVVLSERGKGDYPITRLKRKKNGEKVIHVIDDWFLIDDFFCD